MTETPSACRPSVRDHCTRGLRTTTELEAGLDELRQSPDDDGIVELIVRRPAVDERDLLDEAEIDTVFGIVGDTWRDRAAGTRPTDQPRSTGSSR